ncbi:DUF368 domain-containing protein [soil metagenome]
MSLPEANLDPSPDAPEEQPRRRTRPVVHFGQGLMMGSADVIPGISGGTVALIVGIYERLIEAVRGGTSLPYVLARRGLGKAATAFREIEWGFALPLGMGIITAIVVGARFIPGIMEAYPVESRALFFGLVLASLAIPWRRAGEVRLPGYALAFAAAVIAFVLVGLPVTHGGAPSLFRVFATAAVAICAMILPGVSGAFLLKVLGMYEAALAAISAADVVFVGVFMLGAFTGLALFSKILSWLLTEYPERTMIVLVGLLAGSLRALWPWQGSVFMDGDMVDTPAILLGPPSAGAAATAFAIALVGFALVWGLTWLGAREDRL